MYLPTLFLEERKEVLHRIIEENSFATLISVNANLPVLTHLPFLLESPGFLIAHMAKANPHWRIFETNPNVLVEFHGPHAYISPGWYPPSPLNVPTWNYIAVHVHGKAIIVEEEVEKIRMFEKLIHTNEAKYGTGWKVETRGIETLLSGIVAFRIEIESIEGKLKLSQNQPPATRQNVAEALGASDNTAVKETAKWMLETLKA